MAKSLFISGELYNYLDEDEINTLAKSIDIINHLTASLQKKPFDFIRSADPVKLFEILKQEDPQRIALILSSIDSNKAAILLQYLPLELQSDVARRIATMDLTTMEVLREIENDLEKKLSAMASIEYAGVGGVDTIVEILNLMDRSSETQIIEALENEDLELAEEIKKRMFTFEDIIMLDDRAIQKVLREVDSQELAKALKAVDSTIQEKIFRNMSKRAAGMLQEDMEYMGPVRRKDVEESQWKIVSIIRHLEETGELVVARFGEDELVV
jgi:flagellar motor switch protein FliG